MTEWFHKNLHFDSSSESQQFIINEHSAKDQPSE